MIDFGPTAWPGGAIINGQGYVFVEHAGKGRWFSGLHVVPAPPEVDGGTAMALCGRVSPHGWQRCEVAPPDDACVGRWCYRCADKFCDEFQCAIDDLFLASVSHPDWHILLPSLDLEDVGVRPVLRLVQGGRR